MNATRGAGVWAAAPLGPASAATRVSGQATQLKAMLEHDGLLGHRRVWLIGRFWGSTLEMRRGRVAVKAIYSMVLEKRFTLIVTSSTENSRRTKAGCHTSARPALLSAIPRTMVM
jgi:hypothetical protein